MILKYNLPKTVANFSAPEGNRAELIEGAIMSPAPKTSHQRRGQEAITLLDGAVRSRSLGEVFVSPPTYTCHPATLWS
jgi:hypothetical protein